MTVATQSAPTQPLPVMPATLPEWVRHGLLESGKANEPMLIQGDKVLTGQQLWDEASRLAVVFQQAGLKPGDRVGLLLGQQTELVIGLIAARLAGVVPVPVNLLWQPDDMGYVLQHSGVSALVTDASFLPKLKPLKDMAIKRMLTGKAFHVWVVGSEGQALPPVPGLQALEKVLAKADIEKLKPVAINPHELGLLLYTSGTTARPKGVMLSEANLLANLQGIQAIKLILPTDRILMALPLFHAYGQTLTWLALGLGVPVVLEPSFNPKALVAAVAANHITMLPLVPSLLSVMADGLGKNQAMVDILKPLRLFVSGGAALPPAVLSKINDLTGVPVLEGYGLTETSPVVAVNRLEGSGQAGPKAGTVGIPLPNVVVRLQRDETTGLEQIEIKAPSVMLGYYQDEASTQAVMAPDGWFKTGDVGEWDAEGRLILSGGRIKELIIKDGENISPLRVEAALATNSAVVEVCVVGLPAVGASARGERIGAAVVLAESSEDTADTLRVWSRQHISPLWQPDEWLVVSELPKNATGKVLRRTLKETWSSLEASAAV
ncbi:MAG: AMP-binding protein [Vampirovibrionales bacterium]|nr:AMP-binding protein [Vampirovibrionales bacterium]